MPSTSAPSRRLGRTARVCVPSVDARRAAQMLRRDLRWHAMHAHRKLNGTPGGTGFAGWWAESMRQQVSGSFGTPLARATGQSFAMRVMRSLLIFHDYFARGSSPLAGGTGTLFASPRLSLRSSDVPIWALAASGLRRRRAASSRQRRREGGPRDESLHAVAGIGVGSAPLRSGGGACHRVARRQGAGSHCGAGKHRDPSEAQRAHGPPWSRHGAARPRGGSARPADNSGSRGADRG